MKISVCLDAIAKVYPACFQFKNGIVHLKQDNKLLQRIAYRKARSIESGETCEVLPEKASKIFSLLDVVDCDIEVFHGTGNHTETSLATIDVQICLSRGAQLGNPATSTSDVTKHVWAPERFGIAEFYTIPQPLLIVNFIEGSGIIRWFDRPGKGRTLKDNARYALFCLESVKAS